jgi:hypothetical protein
VFATNGCVEGEKCVMKDQMHGARRYKYDKKIKERLKEPSNDTRETLVVRPRSVELEAGAT